MSQVHREHTAAHAPMASYPPVHNKFIHRRVLPHQRTFHFNSKLDKYNVVKKLGEGTFGLVFKAIHKDTGFYVAMKQIKLGKEQDGFPLTTYREIDTLRLLNKQGDCRNIIDLVDLIFDRPPPNDNYNNYDSSKVDRKLPKAFYMVFPYMSFDLSGLLANPNVHLSEPDIKSILKQLIIGVNFIHDNRYLHRDIKSANILIDARGVLKIGDFGLVRKYPGPLPTRETPGGGTKGLTALVMTRWYRAPEVLFGDDHYTTAVDMWGIGCVFGELYERKPILNAKDDLSQAYMIFELVGEANENSMPNLNKYKFKERNIKLKPTKRNLEERFSKYIDSDGVDLLSKLLTLDPYKRITGLQALDHPFFHIDPKPTENITINFEECHEADIKRFKQEQAIAAANANNFNNNKNNPRNNNFNKSNSSTANSMLHGQHNTLPPIPPVPSNVTNIPGSIPSGPPGNIGVPVGASIPVPPNANGIGGLTNSIAKPKTKFISTNSQQQQHHQQQQRPRHGQRYVPPADIESAPGAPSHPYQPPTNINPMENQGLGYNNNYYSSNRYGGGGYTSNNTHTRQHRQPNQHTLHGPSGGSNGPRHYQNSYNKSSELKRNYGNLEGDRFKKAYDSPNVNGFSYNEAPIHDNGNHGNGYNITRYQRRSGPPSGSSNPSNPSNPSIDSNSSNGMNDQGPIYRDRGREAHYKDSEQARRIEANKRQRIQDPPY